MPSSRSARPPWALLSPSAGRSGARSDRIALPVPPHLALDLRTGTKGGSQCLGVDPSSPQPLPSVAKRPWRVARAAEDGLSPVSFRGRGDDPSESPKRAARCRGRSASRISIRTTCGLRKLRRRASTCLRLRTRTFLASAFANSPRDLPAGDRNQLRPATPRPRRPGCRAGWRIDLIGCTNRRLRTLVRARLCSCSQFPG
jgi:hypothetical protein